MDKRLNTIGLAYMAKKIVFGEEVLNQISKVKLLVMANDTSEKSKERFLKKCTYYNIEVIDCFSGEQISKALGKNNIKVIGITDEGFKRSLLS